MAHFRHRYFKRKREKRRLHCLRASTVYEVNMINPSCCKNEGEDNLLHLKTTKVLTLVKKRKFCIFLCCSRYMSLWIYRLLNLFSQHPSVKNIYKVNDRLMLVVKYTRITVQELRSVTNDQKVHCRKILLVLRLDTTIIIIVVDDIIIVIIIIIIIIGIIIADLSSYQKVDEGIHAVSRRVP